MNSVSCDQLGYHETPVRVHFGQVDRYGYLWHGHAAAIFEIARADVARPFGLSAHEISGAGFAVPMIELRCQYRRPARDDEALVVQSTLLRPHLPLPELRFMYRLLRPAEGGMTEILRGETRQLLLRDGGRLVMRVPAEFRERLERLWTYLESRPRWPAAPVPGSISRGGA